VSLAVSGSTRQNAQPRVIHTKLSRIRHSIDAIMGLCQRAVDTLVIHKNTIDL
jgi:hypothetical protein